MTQKTIIELPFAPGIYTEETDRGATGRWKACDHVRFRYGLPEKIGGWIQKQPQFLGIARDFHDWASLDGSLWTAIGTDWKLYLWQNEVLYDITPIRRTISLTDPFDTTISSSVVTVTDTAHGAITNDFVTFSGATAVGGLTIDGEYQILSTTFGTYTIDAGTAATSTATGGGTVEAEYQINTGLRSAELANGWGIGGYGSDDLLLPAGEIGWNTPRIGTGLTVSARTWSLDNWGEDLIANPFGKALYWWDRTNGTSTRAVILSQAPGNCNIAIISQRDRHLFSMGATERFSGIFDPLLIRWCSQEDLEDWIPTSTNTSGDLRLYRGSKIVSSVKTRGQILTFTDQSVHSVDYLGGFDIYGVNVVGENVSILGPNAVVATDYRVYFMAEGDFYIYDGVLRVLPCDVRNFVYQNLNVAQKDKVFAGLNREFNEIWFFYPGVVGEQSTGDATGDTGGGGAPDPFEDDVMLLIDTETSAVPADVSISNADGDLIEVGDLGSPLGNTATQAQWGDQAVESALSVSNFDKGYATSVSAAKWNILKRDFVIEGWFYLNDRAGDALWTVIIGTSNSQAGFGMVDGDWQVSVRDQTHVGTSLEVTFDWWENGNPRGVSSPIFDSPNDITSDAWHHFVVQREIITPDLSAEICIGVDGIWRDTETSLAASETMTGIDDRIYVGLGTYSGNGPSTVRDWDGSLDDLRITVGQTRYDCSGGVGGTYVVPTATFLSGDPVFSEEINRYVIHNYEENTWATGSLVRTAWHDRSPVLNKPYAANTDGFIYEHENGTDDDGAALLTSLESYDMELPTAGEYLVHVDQLIPDFLDLQGTVNVNMNGRKYPQAAVLIEKGPYPVVPGTRKISLRFRGRQVSLAVASDQIGDYWRMGKWRARVGQHGKR